ncbi:hypothetical protein HanXRQr2_Chr15g0690671 [Helianthus annuus]|uniref:Uncharacterized protein n=1 Tax=Helianthus annuus TaxID=4232 RepID=A0A9K3DZT6_HELAN|nr:hypothetical protein HanXRQr2_Chr15g0690671 [Helianthus annuus]KAJ0831044.1 hypothetical protein HanPSC8_Chr15g0662491 [Helianthus annuus]
MFGYIYCANFSKIYSSETGYTTTFPVALPVSRKWWFGGRRCEGGAESGGCGGAQQSFHYRPVSERVVS